MTKDVPPTENPMYDGSELTGSEHELNYALIGTLEKLREAWAELDTVWNWQRREALRLLDDWKTAEESGTVKQWAEQISAVLARADERRKRKARA